jgi:UDP-N-acetylglucosamine transferase subunit ALG13
MIFATVGSNLPFDRFVETVDRWSHRTSTSVFAQIGAGRYQPDLPFARMLSTRECARRVDEASLVIAHAGMGSFFMAAQAGKPVVLFPRRAGLGEHTNDHQLHTARWLRTLPGVFVAMDASELDGAIEAAINTVLPLSRISRTAPEPFIAYIRKELLN